MSDAADDHELTRYVRHIADLLDLRDWDITVKVGTSEDALGECLPVYGQRRATISLCSTWQEMTPEDVRSTVVHELIHCHLAALTHLLDSVAAEVLHKQVGAMLTTAVSLELEYATDAIACAAAKTLPLLEST